MTKSVLIAIAVTSVVTIGPVDAAGQSSSGVKVGAAGARVAARGPAGFDSNADLGAALGGFIAFSLSDTLRIQPEVLFTLRRFKSADLPENLQVRSRVIEIPVLLSKRWRTSHRMQPVFFAGPQLNVIARVRQTYGDLQSDVTSNIRRLDLCVTAGGGYEVPLGVGAAIMEARVHVGFRDLSKDTDTAMNSRGFLILFGYRF